MRKFFVYFLLLGVFTVTTQLVSAEELPTWVTANYSEDDYLIQAVQHTGGDNLDSVVKDAKKELIQKVFQNANSIFNPRQKQAKNKWAPASQRRVLEQQYSAALYNLNSMRPAQSHLAHHFQQAATRPPTSNSEDYTLVNVKRQKLMRAYVDREQKLQEQINVILARATEAESINQQRALEAYLQTYPLYEQLKEAVLIQQAVKPQQEQDSEAVYRKLLETATGTSDGSLRMPLPEVTKRINQLQHQGRMMRTVDEIAASMVQQLEMQTKGLPKGEITINGFTYRRSGQSMAQARAFQMELRRQLEQADWQVFVPDPVNRGLAEKVSFAIEGTVWKNEDSSGGTFKATIHNVDSGLMVGNSELNLDSGLISVCLPSNYTEMRETELAYDAVNMHTAPRKALTGKELEVDVWTDQDSEQSVYYEGEDITIYCQVNKPAYIRFVYVLADGSYTLLHDSTYIDETKVGKPVSIGEFSVVPPFGSEKLIVLAQKNPHPKVDTTEKGRYRFLNTQGANEAMKAVFSPPARGLVEERASKTISVSTEEAMLTN